MKPSIRVPLCAFLPSLGVGLLDSVASAQEQAFVPPQANVAPLRVKLRAVIPFAQLNLVNPGSGRGSNRGVTFAGASLEVEFRRLWTMEMGEACVVGIGADFPTNFDAFARWGLVPVVYDARNLEGLGWTIQFDALAGYRWLKRNQSPDGHPGTETTHAIRGNLGLDFTRQYSGIAFVARVLSGVSLPLAQTRTGYWESHSYISASEDLKWALDLGIDVGVAL